MVVETQQTQQKHLDLETDNKGLLSSTVVEIKYEEAQKKKEKTYLISRILITSASE